MEDLCPLTTNIAIARYLIPHYLLQQRTPLNKLVQFRLDLHFLFILLILPVFINECEDLLQPRILSLEMFLKVDL